MTAEIYEYKGLVYPDYLKRGNAMRFIQAVALQFCKGEGVDVGANEWPLPGARVVEAKVGGDAYSLPGNRWDYVFSSHCLEHLHDPVRALEHWKSKLRSGGTMFLYLPHPEMEYWLPQNCKKHLHSWYPTQMKHLVEDVGFENVLHSDRDMAWSFSVVGFAP